MNDLFLHTRTIARQVICGVALAATLELGFKDQGGAGASQQQEMVKNIMRGLSLTMPVAAAYMPTSVLVYWT